MNRNLLASIIAFLVFFAVAPLLGSEEPMVAKVNGVGVTKAEFDRNWPMYLQQKGIPATHADKSGKVDEFKDELLNILVEQEILVQESTKLGYAATEKMIEEEITTSSAPFPTPEAFDEMLAQSGLTRTSLGVYLGRRLSVQQMINKEYIEKAAVTDDEVKEYYEKNPDQFSKPETVKARHILIKVDPAKGEEGKTDARSRAEAVLKKVKDGGDFAELAKESSEGPSGPKGGDLGEFGHGKMVKPFDEAAFALEVGGVSEIVETRFGFHVIKVDEKSAAKTISLDEVGDQIRGFLQETKARDNVAARLGALMEEAKIEKLLGP